MARTRSGLLERFDLTEIDDSDEEVDGGSSDEAYDNHNHNDKESAEDDDHDGEAQVVAAPTVAAADTTVGASVSASTVNENVIILIDEENEEVEVVIAEAPASSSAIDRTATTTAAATTATATATDIATNGFSICRPVEVAASLKANNGNDEDEDDDDDDDDDDEVEIVGESNAGSNPFVDFPHRREDCQTFDFANNPEAFCPQCFCYICDIKASDCKEWISSSSSSSSNNHCQARHDDEKSRQYRRSLQIRKNMLRPRRGGQQQQQQRRQLQLQMPLRLQQLHPPPLSAAAAAAASSLVAVSPTRRRRRLRQEQETSSSLRIGPTTRRRPDDGLLSVSSVVVPQVGRNARPRARARPPVVAPQRIRARARPPVVAPQRISRRRQVPVCTAAATTATAAKSITTCTTNNISTSISSSSSLNNGSTSRKRKIAVVAKAGTRRRITRKSSTVTATATVIATAQSSKSSSSPSPSQRTISRSSHLRVYPLGGSPLAAPAPAPAVSTFTTRKRKQAPMTTTTTTTTTTRSDRQSDTTGGQKTDKTSTTQKVFAAAATDTAAAATTMYHTRSSNSANKTTAPEVYGTLGAYWRGEQTKYAGVPYQTIITTTTTGNATTKTKTARAEAATPTPTPTTNANANANATHTIPDTAKEATPTMQNRQYGTLGPYWRGEQTCVEIKRRPLSAPAADDNNNDEVVVMPKSKRIKTPGTLTSIMIPTAVAKTRTTNSAAAAAAPAQPEGVEAVLEASAAITTLEGKLSYDVDSRKYSIYGTWHCPLSKSFPPQKFELSRIINDDDEEDLKITQSIDGEFTGYCMITSCSTTSEGEIQYHNHVVFESDIQLKFASTGGNTDDDKKRVLHVNGSGTNEFGAFRINGTAKPCIGEKNLYTIALKKRYELPSFADCAKKRNDRAQAKNNNCNSSEAREKPMKRKLIYSGCPLQPMEGGWPRGWAEEVFRRQAGASQGQYDRYWSTPGKGFKLRSMKNVRKFMALVEKTKGDEKKAIKLLNHYA